MNFYETPDLGLVAALVTIGHPVTGTHTKEGKTIFTFEYSKHLMDLASKYFGSGLEVDAKSYYYTLRDIKKIIYEKEVK